MKRIQVTQGVDFHFDTERWENVIHNPSTYTSKDIANVFAEQQPSKVAYFTISPREDSGYDLSVRVAMQSKAYSAAAAVGATMEVFSNKDLAYLVMCINREEDDLKNEGVVNDLTYLYRGNGGTSVGLTEGQVRDLTQKRDYEVFQLKDRRQARDFIKSYDAVVLAVADCFDCNFAHNSERSIGILTALYKAVGEKVYAMTSENYDKSSCSQGGFYNLQKKLFPMGYDISDLMVK